MAEVRGRPRAGVPPRRGVWAAAGLLLLLGCDARPRAPALLDEPVYQDEREGFRFLVPEGWKQYARSEVPPGKVERERLLVLYRRLTPGQEATLQVTCADLPPATDLAAYLAGPSFGADRWRLKASAEAVVADGVRGLRYAFAGRTGKRDMGREVAAFRRGERVYFFTALFPAADSTAREQVRRAVGSIRWKHE
jgi:hypothetical protein